MDCKKQLAYEIELGLPGKNLENTKGNTQFPHEQVEAQVRKWAGSTSQGVGIGT